MPVHILVIILFNSRNFSRSMVPIFDGAVLDSTGVGERNNKKLAKCEPQSRAIVSAFLAGNIIAHKKL